jgi:hypothetical protein
LTPRRTRPLLLAIIGIVAGAVSAWIVSSVVIDVTAGDVALAIAAGYVSWVAAALLAIAMVRRIMRPAIDSSDKSASAVPEPGDDGDPGHGGVDEAPPSLNSGRT